MRQNYGGGNQFAADHIYPYLFAENISESHVSYVPKSEANKVMTRNLFDVMTVSLKTAEDNTFNNTIDMYQGTKYGTKPDYYLDTAESFINYLDNNAPKGFDELYANDESIRYAYEYLTT